NAANDRVTGAGFNSWSANTYARYSPDATKVLVAHSIYFGVIADHGWIGFLMFVGIFTGVFFLAKRVSRVADTDQNYRWVSDLAKMIQVSLVAYGTGGAFLSLAYYDLPWHLAAIVLLLRQLLVREGVWETKPKTLAEKLQLSQGHA
ncbi:MAG: hypothetical protein LJE59_05850, partial [Chromatiaceae bacterium]|nr:hypothetical protein [Chromatiaceae bacterium]